MYQKQTVCPVVRRMHPEDDLGRNRIENAGLTIHAVQLRTWRRSLEPETGRMKSPWKRVRPALAGLVLR